MGIVYQFLQAMDKFFARNFTCTQRSQMRRVHLAIDHAEIPMFKLFSEMRDGYFGRIGSPAEHGFAVKHPAYCNAIKAADPLAVYPRFHRMRITPAMQLAVGRDDIFQYPSARLPFARGGTVSHHLLKGGVKSDFISPFAQYFAQRM